MDLIASLENEPMKVNNIKYRKNSDKTVDRDHRVHAVTIENQRMEKTSATKVAYRY